MQKSLLFCFFSCCLLFSFAQGTSRGPGEDERLVRIAHQEDYPGASEVVFFPEDKGYLVSFVHHGYIMKVRYTFDAALVYEEFVVPSDRYDRFDRVFDLLKTQYPGYLLTHLYLCDTVGEKYYLADIQHRGKPVQLKFDLDMQLVGQ